MTGDELLDVAGRALAAAGGEAIAGVVHERSLMSRFAGSRPTQATAVDDVSVSLTAVRDGHTATATTSGLDDGALREVAARAVAAAEASARSGPGAYPGPPDPGPAAPPHAGWDAETADLDPRRAGAALTAAFDVAAEQGLEAFGVWTAGAVRTAVASSAGAAAVDSVTDAYMKVLCRDGGGARSGFGAGAGVAARDLDPAAIARAAARRAPAGERAELSAGEYDVVLDAAAVGSLLDMLGPLAFDGLAHAEARGALAGKLGQRVAAPAVNLSDSPRFAGTLPRAFDAEGVAKRPLPLVQDGVAHAVVHDARSAAVAGGGAGSTGHALAPGGAGGPAPTNLVLVGGGAASVEELAAPVERGVYVTRLWYVNPVDAKRTLVTGMTRDGTFLIEDGRISRPLRDVRFTDSILRLLGAVQALGSQPRLVSEGEFYGRRSATGVVCPPLRARGFRVTGGGPG